MLYIPQALWNKIEDEHIEKVFLGNMNTFLLHLITKGLKGEIQSEIVDIKGEELKDKQLELFEQEKNFYAQIRQLFISGQEQPKPENYENKVKRVIQAIGTQRIRFEQIADITQIPKSELLIIMANLVGELLVGYDEELRYYIAGKSEFYEH